jgi:hypothetical protein
MIGPRSVGRVISASMAVAVLLTGTGAATSQGGASKTLLLSPRVHVGEIFAWNGRITSSHSEKTSGSSTTVSYSHSVAYTCSVLAVAGDSITMSRSVSVFVDDRGLPVVVGYHHGHWIGPSARSPIIIRDGEAFKTDGEPLKGDPMCLFFTVAWFGTPPAKISSGASWRFSQPAWIPGLMPNERGIATVTSLDSTRSAEALHVSLTPPDENQIVERLDMTITDGGVIDSEVWRSEDTRMPGIGTVHDVSVWTLKRS